MKILIGYDGSESADAALEDLRNAGIPAQAEGLIVTATEIPMPVSAEREKALAVGGSAFYNDAETQKTLRESLAEQLKEAEEFAASAKERLRNDFPHWLLQSEAVADFPERLIIEGAKKYQPDLIVVGSNGRGRIKRLILGSVSLKILTQALCSVRVARRSPARTDDDDSPARVIIGFDGSPDSLLAVEAVAKRAWRQDSAVRLVTAVEPLIHPAFQTELQKAEEQRFDAVRRLKAAGLHVSTVTKLGAAKYVLVEEAKNWASDAIFLGARGHKWTSRVLLGSVSYAVAARAGCSVEAVRENMYSLFYTSVEEGA